MSRRASRVLVAVVVALQLLLGAPLAAALASTSAGESHCADAQDRTHGADECPCCPEGASDPSSCVNACLGAFVTVANFDVPEPRGTHAAPRALLIAALADLPDPPLEPPRIA